MGPTLTLTGFFPVIVATPFHSGSSGTKEGLHMMSPVVIMRLDVVVNAPEEGLPGKK